MSDETKIPGEQQQVRLLVPRHLVAQVDDLSVLLGIPRQSVFRAVLVLGLGEMAHRWKFIYPDLLDQLEQRRRARSPGGEVLPLDVELEKVANPSGPEINALEG